MKAGETPTLTSGMMRYGDNWHVYGSPEVKNSSLTIGEPQTLDFFSGAITLDAATGIPETTALTTSSGAGQQLTISSGATLTNNGMINFRGAYVIKEANGGRCLNLGDDDGTAAALP
jgi:hypothetical protein